MSTEFDQLVAQVEQFQSTLRRVDEQFAGVGDMQQQLVELEVVATNPSRSVTVVAGASGAIKDIGLTDAAMRQPPQALAAELMSTLRQAVAEAARRQAGIVDDALGPEMGLTEQVLDLQAELFGIAPEDLRPADAPEQPPSPAAPPPPEPVPDRRPPGPVRRPAPPRGRVAEDPDDFEQESFLGNERQAPPHRSGPGTGHHGRPLDFYEDE